MQQFATLVTHECNGTHICRLVNTRFRESRKESGVMRFFLGIPNNRTASMWVPKIIMWYGCSTHDTRRTPPTRSGISGESERGGHEDARTSRRIGAVIECRSALRGRAFSHLCARCMMGRGRTHHLVTKQKTDAHLGRATTSMIYDFPKPSSAVHSQITPL